ncbi:MAG: hypothetical protein V7767_05790 [Leeuwenhoekiella sp.]
MDELELLKKDWKRQEASLPRINASDIYKMILKKSSSLTKWILIIAILEFVFWITISVAMIDKNYFEHLKSIHFYTINIILSVIHYGVLLFFIYWFYNNYRKIKTTDDIKRLMRNILKVRKTVNYYVIYNLAMSFIISVMVFIASVLYDPNLSKIWSADTSKNIWLIGAIIIFILVFLFVLWLFYKLLYGILLRRLHRNYKELNKLELRN